MSSNFDHDREMRTGLPEVILAEPKKESDLIETITAALEIKNNVLITRILNNQIGVVEKISKEMKMKITWDRYKRTAILGDILYPKIKYKAAIISGGTSDKPIVEEIQLSLQFFGIEFQSFVDVGVAGIHRHQIALQNISDDENIKIIIVVAGAEGALFSVISAQTKFPVIAVPASTTYGYGGKGKAALMSALQSCSPGIATVNIDNGFGAASFARKLLSSIDS